MEVDIFNRIPEKIKKLMTSENQDDIKLGFHLAKLQGLENDKDFQAFVFWKVQDVENFVDRTFAGTSTDGHYNYFKILD